MKVEVCLAKSYLAIWGYTDACSLCNAVISTSAGTTGTAASSCRLCLAGERPGVHKRIWSIRFLQDRLWLILKYHSKDWAPGNQNTRASAQLCHGSASKRSEYPKRSTVCWCITRRDLCLILTRTGRTKCSRKPPRKWINSCQVLLGNFPVWVKRGSKRFKRRKNAPPEICCWGETNNFSEKSSQRKSYNNCLKPAVMTDLRQFPE